MYFIQNNCSVLMDCKCTGPVHCQEIQAVESGMNAEADVF